MPTQSGQLPVAAGRGGPFKIDWEVHGKGDIKLVVRGPPFETLLSIVYFFEHLDITWYTDTPI